MLPPVRASRPPEPIGTPAHSKPAPSSRRFRRRWECALLAGALLALVFLPVAGAEGVTKRFDLPAGDAEKALQEFSTQSGREVLFSSESTTGIRTNPVKGDLPPNEAIHRLVDGTGLIVRLNEKTGAFVISRQRAADPPPLKKNG